MRQTDRHATIPKTSLTRFHKTQTRPGEIWVTKFTNSSLSPATAVDVDDADDAEATVLADDASATARTEGRTGGRSDRRTDETEPFGDSGKSLARKAQIPEGSRRCRFSGDALRRRTRTSGFAAEAKPSPERYFQAKHEANYLGG